MWKVIRCPGGRTSNWTVPHARRIIHGTLNPGNILITANGVVKLADFGLAQGRRLGVTDRMLTGPSGTPSYTSPQQQRDKPAVRSDDIYSLGATLYEALTGAARFVERAVSNPLASCCVDYQCRTCRGACSKR